MQSNLFRGLILSVDPAPVQKGTLTKYALRWRIFPIRWTTEIIEWEPPYRFVDLQLKSPYKLWRHEHRFTAEASGSASPMKCNICCPLAPSGRSPAP